MLISTKWRVSGTSELVFLQQHGPVTGDSDTRSVFIISTLLSNLLLATVTAKNPALFPASYLCKIRCWKQGRVFQASVVLSGYFALNYNPESFGTKETEQTW